MRNLLAGTIVLVGALFGGLPASAALHDRGCGLVYDDVLDITWLKNVTLAAGSPYDDEYVKAPPSPTSATDGKLSYYSALRWVQSLEYFDCIRGVVLKGWRLPMVRPVNGAKLNVLRAYDGSTDIGYNITSPMHELAYMYYVNLKNKGRYDSSGRLQTGYGLVEDPDDPTDESLFVHLYPASVWSSTIHPNDTNAFRFLLDKGQVDATSMRYVYYAWAVRDGDVDTPQPIDISALSAAPAVLLDTHPIQLSVTAVDPDPGPQGLSYQWSVVSRQGTLVNADRPNPTFLPTDVTGSESETVVVRLDVSDGISTVTRYLPLQVNDGEALPPPALIQIDSISAMPASLLDTETSELSVVATDPDAGPQTLSYQWTIVSGGGVLDNPSSATPVYTPADVVGTRSVTLKVVVSDGDASVSGNLTLTVEDADPPPPGVRLLSDDFSGSALTGWSVHDEGGVTAPSKWRIVSGELAQQSNINDGSSVSALTRLGTYLLYDEGLSWSDYRLKYKFRSTDDDPLGVMFRYIDNNNYYRFSWDRQRKERRLVKKAGGVFTLLAADNVPYVVGQSYQVEVVAQGSQMEVWVDGARIVQATDAAHNRGSVTFYTWMNSGAYFDDLVVEDLSGGIFNALPKITAVTASPSTILDTGFSDLSVVATDPDDGPQALSYQWSIVSGGGVLDNASGATPVYTPADGVGTQSVTLKVDVSDGAATVSGNLTLTVEDANAPPLGLELLKEDFSGATLTGWSVHDEGTVLAPSKWRLASGELAQVSNIYDGSTANDLAKRGTYLLHDGGAGWTDYRAELNLRSTDNDSQGLMFRVVDENNYYRFSWDKELKQRRLVKKTGGVFTLLAADNVPYVMGQNYQVEAVAQGGLLEVWVDGVRIFQVGDTDHAQGSIAFYSWKNSAAFFDDVQVNAIE